jgi:hypothetical protein
MTSYTNVSWKTRNNPKHKSKSNINVCISEIRCEAVTQVQWRDLVLILLNI